MASGRRPNGKAIRRVRKEKLRTVREVHKLIEQGKAERGFRAEERASDFLIKMQEQGLVSSFVRAPRCSLADRSGYDFFIALPECPSVFFPLQIKSSHTGRIKFEEKLEDRLAGQGIPVLVVSPGVSDDLLYKQFRSFILRKCRSALRGEGVDTPSFSEEELAPYMFVKPANETQGAHDALEKVLFNIVAEGYARRYKKVNDRSFFIEFDERQFCITLACNTRAPLTKVETRVRLDGLVDVVVHCQPGIGPKGLRNAIWRTF